MVCGGLRWFSRFLTAHCHTDVLSSHILVVVCGGLRWCVVVCGGLWWFAVVCGGLWWIAVPVVCLLVIPTESEVNWLLRAFALSQSFVIGLSFTLRVGMPMFSRLFALMNDQNRFGFVNTGIGFV